MSSPGEPGRTCFYCARPIAAGSNVHILEEDRTLRDAHSGCAERVMDDQAAMLYHRRLASAGGAAVPVHA